jgi:DNA mismatch endonuclease (patch repair protein)
MDNLTRAQRRKNMQHIRSTDTLPERIVMQELKRRKIYFASHVSEIEGKPDIVFRRKKILVFIDSDFWHGHPKRCVMPKSNVEYWKSKIERNRKRDKDVNRKLNLAGWKVIRIWEYDVKHKFEKSFRRIMDAVKT